MRVFFGLFASCINAPIYDTIGGSFPPSFRTTANSIEHTGYYLGGGLTSLCVIAIKSYGWRFMYQAVGAAGILLAALTYFFVRDSGLAEEELDEDEEPDDAEEPEEKVDVLKSVIGAFTSITKNPTARWVTLGGMCRFFGFYCLAFFMPAYALNVYPTKSSQFALFNGLI